MPVVRGPLAVALAVVALAGLAFRLVGLGGSLQLDEFGTLWVVEGPLGGVIPRALSFHGQSPLYYLLCWAPVHALGESEVALRLVSLVAGAITALVLGAVGREAAGPTAGLVAACFAWLEPGLLEMSTNARPYTLGTAGLSIMLLGFLRATRAGTPAARALFVLGGVLTFYAHYALALPAAGLALAWGVTPAYRERYPAKRFLTDVALQLLLVAPCAPQLLSLFARRHELASGLVERGGGLDVFLVPLEVVALPLLVAALGVWRGRTDVLATSAPAARTLLACVAVPAALMALLALGGPDLRRHRYAVGLLAPALVLAARAVASLRDRERQGVLGLGVVACAAFYGQRAHERGTFSGVGGEDWRAPVALLEQELARAPGAPVLYRSGFFEDDLRVRGVDVAVTRAPLRAPGQPPPSFHLVPLTFHWEGLSGREEYFSDAVAPAVRDVPVLFFVSHATGGYAGEYAESLVAWLERVRGRPVRWEALAATRGIVLLKLTGEVE
jgi:4-amino-4-deoxy-L-arabinose transferase-like glycosyltransferase